MRISALSSDGEAAFFELLNGGEEVKKGKNCEGC